MPPAQAQKQSAESGAESSKSGFWSVVWEKAVGEHPVKPKTSETAGRRSARSRWPHSRRT